MIVVDYGSLMKPTIIHKDKRDNYEQTYLDLRQLCDDFDCAMDCSADK